MQTVKINTAQYKTRPDLENFLRKKELKRGDKVKISPPKDEAMAAGMVVVLVLVILYIVLSEKRQKQFTDSILDDLFNNLDAEEFEKHIEDEFGINIEIKETSVKDEDEESWSEAGIRYLNNAYSHEEPDYSNAMIKEPNPDYKP